MGSVTINNTQDQNQQENGSVDILSTGLACDGFRSFHVVGLATDQVTAPTGMRDEILLLSWLIVLLRTRERSQTYYDWAYTCPESGFDHKASRNRLSMDGMDGKLQNTVSQIAEAISSHTSTITPIQRATTPGPVSLLLSTSSLSSASEESKVEGIIHIEISFDNGDLQLRPVWYNESMPRYTVTRYIETLVDTVKMCISNPNASIEDCLQPTEQDLEEIWKWNHLLPPSHNYCMHDIISEQAQRFPEKVAISSWDGNLTYSQVEQYSTLVACSLKELNVESHDILPVCFEKSRWTIVAVLAVMKAGATFVLMDPTLPVARLQNMAQQVDAKMVLSSRKQYSLSTSIILGGKPHVVEAETFTNLSSLDTIPKFNLVPPSALMYIIFTSGSTGTPKGVKISHQTYTSSAIPRAEAVGYTEDSMVLDFASYAFDVSIDSMLLTLGNGGCLCIPSDEDRLNDINRAIRRMRVNYAGLTPSVARILEPDVIASLSGLGLGGEAASARDVNLWGKVTRIIIGYGPCECTIGCTINSSAATGRDYISIGKGNGAAIWIVDPNDHESLMPVGAIGEMLVEGPIVGQGYLNDDDKTATAFIHDPPWLLTGHKNYNGRQGRMYKTGDLGKYDPDGSGGIVFVGRKDTQVKLRGQRVELGEIESQLKARLPLDASVIAEVIVPLGSGSQPTLVAFIVFQSTKRHDHTEIRSVQLDGDLRKTLSEANAELAKVLPRYMVPNAYIPINYSPVLISGKTNRKLLREFGATVDLRQLEQGASSVVSRQLSDLERKLRQAWSQTLKLDPETIRTEDNFFALGGDSLTAMRLVSVCRGQGLDLTVVGIFSHPTLSEMASVVHSCSVPTRIETPAFAMISKNVKAACLEASKACESDPTAIEDIYPCTPTQESLFTFSIKSAKPYVAQRVAHIPSHIALDAWRKAWEDAVAANPILRTRLVQLGERGLQQVVLAETISWRHSPDLAKYLENDRKEKMDIGQSLARYAIVENSANGQRYMVWTVHHVLYDGWSEPLILKHVLNSLHKQHTEIQAQMKDFVKYVRNTDEVAAREFWRRELNNAVGPQFPRTPNRDFLPIPDTILEHQVTLDTLSGLPFTTATLIRGAWALVASQYTGSDDVVFGETLVGRDIAMAGVENIIGPLIATIPIRIHINRMCSVESYLQTVQNGTLARTPYQHMGMQNIRKVSQDAQYACETGTGLVIQPEPESVSSELGFGQGDVVREALHFNPYPLMLACGISKRGFSICASFDSRVIEIPLMERILAQLEMACLNLSKGLSRRIEDISCLPEAELNQIWQKNQTPPLTLEESSRRFRAGASIQHGSPYPPVMTPWVCDPRNPSRLSPIDCVGELWLEGAHFPGAMVESPTWLVAGSPAFVGRTGKVQSTGDLVQLREDNSLIFVGRKENVLPIQGHRVDIADLEAHLANNLPQTNRTAAAVFESSLNSIQDMKEQELIIFVEQQSYEEGNTRLLSVKHDVTCGEPGSPSVNMTICALIPASLAITVKRLDRFIRDSLPSYMVPSGYVVVDKIPTIMGQIDHGLLNQLASMIPQQVIAELLESFRRAWMKSSAQTNLTLAESILRSSWAKILGISAEKIDPDDNFFRLGGDSILAMKLVSDLRAQGQTLTVADIFQHMRLRDAATVLKVNQVPEEKPQDSKPFSTLRDLDIEPFLSGVVQPKLADPRWSIQDVFPVTNSQTLDIRATIQLPRTSIQYTMLYLDKDVDREHLLRACSELVKTHDILRTIFIEHESNLFQVVIDGLNAPVAMHWADTDLEKLTTNLCMTDIESNYHLGAPFFKMMHVEGNDGRQCLIIGLSHSQYDGISLPILLRDLEALYTSGKVIQPEPFSSYMSHICDEAVQAEALGYWRNLLNGSSLSVLAGTSVQASEISIFQTKTVDISQRPVEITTANLLTAAWSLVLARRLRKADVTFGSVTSGRNINLSNSERVVGPCYQFTPVRVSFQSQWTAMDLLRFVQRQSAESMAHDFLGFEKISKKCTQWSSEASFFDSIVHHKDFEDMDTMPFAGGSCRVDILNPHGVAPHPLKAVSFIQDGQTSVGVVGSESDPAFVAATLNELVIAIQELANCQSEQVLLEREIF